MKKYSTCPSLPEYRTRGIPIGARDETQHVTARETRRSARLLCSPASCGQTQAQVQGAGASPDRALTATLHQVLRTSAEQKNKSDLGCRNRVTVNPQMKKKLIKLAIDHVCAALRVCIDQIWLLGISRRTQLDNFTTDII
jgi:hypothetical protein